MSQNESSRITAHKQRVAGAFNRTAPMYDQIGPHFFTYFGERLVTLAQIKPGSKVLDIACGRGAVLFPAAREIGVNGVVIGIDLAEGMVKQTELEIGRSGVLNAKVQQMDAEQLQFEDNSFDYVLSGLALLFFPQPERALAEMRRVLTPGGYLAISTWDRQGDKIWRWFEDDLYHKYVPPIPEPVEPEPDTPSMDTPGQLSEALRSAGFEEIQVIEESVEMTYRSAKEWWDALWATSMRLMLEEIEQTVGQEGLERFRQDVFEHLKSMQQSDGIHQYWPLLLSLARKPNR